MSISKNIEEILSRSSWIRKMFEEGSRLKAEHGAENVFDFSLGNPNVEPPEQFSKILKETASTFKPGSHAYMPNIGYLETRRTIADFLTDEQGVFITAEDIVMTCGAAGALNVALKTILNPGEEVITPAPYFVEYNFYVGNHGGILKTVPTRSDFDLDIAAIEQAITPDTRAVLINSPNNPTGKIYTQKVLAELSSLLAKKGKKLKKTIYLISDEPYRKIVFDNMKVPSVLADYPNSIIATSYSKDLSIPGERIGFLAVNPSTDHRDNLLAGLALSNRILGYVNAPALMQRIIEKLQGISVDPKIYQKKRDLLCDALADYGYSFEKPSGAFYLFPKAPIPDDVAFVKALQEELILTVPGSGFGGPGHFRIAFCVDDKTIIRALPGFKRTIERLQ
ncbi:MAG: pyridoxal phosphate-dependent aminotransferase [Deltaproteobacteria bacterium]|nr:pyridoxal phosphate-dependent aminotransferase [Deltaproteobacteria bacterium]